MATLDSKSAHLGFDGRYLVLASIPVNFWV
jgi:hypothetical protein